MCSFTVWQSVCPCVEQERCRNAHQGQVRVDGLLHHFVDDILIEGEACPFRVTDAGTSLPPSRDCQWTHQDSREGWMGDPVRYVFRYPRCDVCYDECLSNDANEGCNKKGDDNKKDNDDDNDKSDKKVNKSEKRRSKRLAEKPWFVVFGKSTPAA